MVVISSVFAITYGYVISSVFAITYGYIMYFNFLEYMSVHVYYLMRMTRYFIQNMITSWPYS
jgi:hypothetical protein